MTVAPEPSREVNVVVVGGGVLGSTVAYHLARDGARVTVVDRGLAGASATAGNFGLVWVQDKAPTPYLALTMRSAQLYPELGAELLELTGIDVEYERPGGLHFCLSDGALEARARFVAGQGRTEGFRWEMIERPRLEQLEPSVGPEVVGASFSPLDGHTNPLALLRALHAGVRRLGGSIVRATVRDIASSGPRRWIIGTDAGTFESGALVLAAGVAIRGLGMLVDLEVPVRPQRGQILVSEPLPPLVHHPSVPARQSRHGTVFMGASHEEVGFDQGTTAEAIGEIATGALRCFPALGRARLVRAWGALRPLTPDGLPIFEQPAGLPGLYLVTTHSGITLCPVVGRAFAEWIATEERPAWLPRFDRGRFPAISRDEAAHASPVDVSTKHVGRVE